MKTSFFQSSFSIRKINVRLVLSCPDRLTRAQEAAYSVLRETVAIDAPRLAKKAEESRGRHQNPRYCEQLLSLATAAQSTGDT